VFSFSCASRVGGPSPGAVDGVFVIAKGCAYIKVPTGPSGAIDVDAANAGAGPVAGEPLQESYI